MNTEEQKNLFKVWLQKTRNVGSSTLISYTDRVLEKLLEIIEYSKNPSLKSINPNMYFYQTIEDFDKFVLLLKNDPNFDIVNKTGQPQGGWVSTPLNHYRKFLLSNKTESQNINESIEFLREKLINFYKAKGLEIKETGAYTALKYNKNVAEVHKATKQTNRFRIVINYDLLNDEFKNEVRKVPDSYNWTNLNGEFWIDSEKTFNSAIEKINNILSKINKQEAVYTAEIKQGDSRENIPLNQILYGPPGTGKTYNTVLKAMSIIDNTEYKDVSEEQYSALKTRFDELKQAGQIEFVTFHQSYSYEEFVEGIKPNLNDEKLGYVLENGIFKNICDHAKPIVTTTIKREPLDFSNTKVFKMSLGNTLEKEDDIYDYCIENNVVSLGWKDVDFSDCKTRQDFKDRDDSWGATALERFVKWMDIGDIIIISNGNRNFRAIAQVKSDYFYDKNTPISYTHFRKVEWLYKGEDIHYSKINDKIFSQQSIYGYFSPSKKGQQDYNPDLKTDELNKIITGEVNKEVSKPHILIIDEINRGDVSKIFGELITLIEEDKRIGNKYQMKTTLPYSKESFGVPNNLYIIGTMNTADRSIALLDTALRRRFDFEEIMPRPELLGGKVVEGINLQTLLTRINERITNKYDRDHQIGHSYLMGVNTKEQLERAYKNRILPLLNEYFYNESKTVAEILNCSEDELKTSDFISILGKAQGA